MFRIQIYDRKNLDSVARFDVPVVSAEISEDLAQCATSTIVVADKVSTTKIGDIVGLYDNNGKFIYLGVVETLSDESDYEYREITCGQIQSLFKDELLLTAQTSTNQKAFYNNKSVSYPVKMYLDAKIQGYSTIKNSMTSGYVYTFSGFKDVDLANTFKKININASDETDTTHLTYPRENETVTLEDYLYDIFDEHSRIVSPQIKFDGDPDDLPSTCQRLDYVEFTGTQYVDTGILFSKTTDVEIEFIPTDDSGSDYEDIIGTRDTTNSTYFYVRLSQESPPKITVRITNIDAIKPTSIEADETYTFKYEHGVGVTINDTLYSYTGTPTAVASYNLYLGAWNNNGTAGHFFKGKVKSFKIIKDGTVVANYIPVYFNGTLVQRPAFYDTISKAVKHSSGATLVAGNNIDSKHARYINLNCVYPSGTLYEKDYSDLYLFDKFENILNLSVEKEDEDYNTVHIYNDDGSTLRGVYTIQEDDTIVKVTSGTAVSNRAGANKTVIVFDTDNTLTNIAKENLSTLKYKHNISFTIIFTDQYKFYDFCLGKSIKFYYSKDNVLYNSMLTAWSYSITNSSNEIKYASFTLGKVRNSLTDKLNKATKSTKKNK